jgi:tetratricopeptide (TPR) repeat protein
MKTFNIFPCLIAILWAATTTPSFSADEKYLAAMQKNIQAIYEAKTIGDLQGAVNAFERIAAAENTRWEPLYYAAFGNVMMSARAEDAAKKDEYIDNAISLIGKARSLAPEESELFALEGFALMMRVTVDPGTRGPQFAGLAVRAYDKAIQLNPENPRAWALLAQMQYGTAQFFGSSTAEACESLATALAKFETYKSENPLAPQWGRPMAAGLKEKCK